MPLGLTVSKGDLIPRQRSLGILLDYSRGLADQTTFKMHLRLTTTLTRARLESLCEEEASSALSSMEKLKDVVSRYGGKGGRIIQHKT